MTLIRGWTLQSGSHRSPRGPCVNGLVLSLWHYGPVELLAGLLRVCPGKGGWNTRLSPASLCFPATMKRVVMVIKGLHTLKAFPMMHCLTPGSRQQAQVTGQDCKLSRNLSPFYVDCLKYFDPVLKTNTVDIPFFSFQQAQRHVFG